MKLCFVDFEFNSISEPYLNLVSCSAVCTSDTVQTYRRDFWLHRGKETKQAKAFFQKIIKEGYTFVAYVAEAEYRSLQSLFRESPTLPFIDLYLEYRNLLNRNDELAYGKQYIDGKILTTKRPPNKWELVDEEDDEAHHKPSYSLAAACFKLLGVQIDTVEKKEVRDIIIANDYHTIEANRERIQKYNASDIEYLPKLLNTMAAHNSAAGILLTDFLKAAYLRGDFACRTARMVTLGYPVNMDKLKRFVSNVDHILTSAIRDVMESTHDFEPFRYDKKKKAYICNQAKIRQWVKDQAKPYWRKTKTGSVSISKDAFKDWYDSQSEGFPGAFCRYLATKQSLNGFLPVSEGSDRKSFFEFVGSDCRVRPFFGIYGSQTSRNQPSTVGFIPLKAHWMRNFIEAGKGRGLAGVDYSSQEFLISALISQDKVMISDYQTGDVYLAFAKGISLAPPEATKESHKPLRDMCKALVLGLSYDMTAKGLAPRMTQALGKEVTVQTAEELVEQFSKRYFTYFCWKQDILEEYETYDRLQLQDGWTMWGSNDNPRSVGNFPVQGTGAVVMREAVRLAQKSGIEVLFPLHDAIYIEYQTGKEQTISLLMACMQEAFRKVMSKYGPTVPIGLEGEAWSVDYKHKMPNMKIKGITYLQEYIDRKSERDIERYREFFTEPQSSKELHNGISESGRREQVLQV